MRPSGCNNVDDSSLNIFAAIANKYISGSVCGAIHSAEFDTLKSDGAIISLTAVPGAATLKGDTMSIFKSLPVLVLLALLALPGCHFWDRNPTEPPSTNGTIEGRVYDAATNRPIYGAVVTTDRPPKTVTTDSAGYYKISGLPEGGYTLRAQAQGYHDVVIQAKVVAKQTTTQHIPMRRDRGEERPGNALLFGGSWGYDGHDQGARIENARDLSLSHGSFTVEAWFKLEERNTWQWIVGKAHSNARLDYLFGIDGHRLVLSTRNATNVVYSNTNIETNRWYHAAGVQDAAARKLYLYLDGQLVGTLPLGGSGVTISNNVFIGARELEGGDLPVEGFNGVINDVRVWNVARSHREIAAARGTRLSGNESGLVAYWPMNEGLGSMLRDVTGRGHTAELVNGPDWITTDVPIR